MSVVLLTEPFSGGGSGSGTVTSVDVSGGTTGLTTSGGPVTTAGVITLGGTLSVGSGGTGAVALTGILKGTGTTPITIATAGTDYQAPITLTTTGTSGAATFVGNVLNIPQYSGGGGGTGTVTTVSVVSANGLAGTVANATTTPAITLSTTVTGVLKGDGTAISAATSGTDYAPATSGTSILYGNGAGGFSNVTVGSGLSFSTGTLSATNSGTVTSVGATAPVASSGGATPTISLNSAYGDTLNPYASKTANYVLSAPNGTAGVPTFRALVAADIPSLNYQAPITLTTTGTSGAATFVGNTLNIPNYATSGGTVTSVSGTGTVNGITLTGTVTSSGSLTLGGTLANVDLATQVTGNLPVTNLGSGTGASSTTFWRGDGTWATPAGSGSGTVTSVSVVSANGLAGTVSNPTTTPAITLSTSVTGLLKGNGTAISAATAGTDYQAPITLTTTGTSGAATFIGNTLNIPQYTGGGGSPGGSDTQIQFNNSGSFGGSANFTWDGTNVQLGTQGALRFADADSSNYVAFKAPSTIGTNVTWTLPSIDGSSAQVLSTNGAGTLYWATQTGGGGGSPNLDGGTPTSNYGGITAIDGGTP